MKKKEADLKSTMDNYVDRLRVLGSSGFVAPPAEIVLNHQIMLFDHIENPNGILARNARHTARWHLVADHTTRPTPRDSKLHCTFFIQEPYPNEHTEKIRDNDPDSYTECLKFWKTDKNIPTREFDVNQIYVKYIHIHTHNMELRMSDLPESSFDNEFCLGKLYLPYDRLFRILNKIGVTDLDERNRYVNYDFYRNDLMTRELKMYTNWRQPVGRIYKLTIEDNATDKVLYSINDYYPCMYAHYFDDLAAAYFLGMYERTASQFNVKSAIDDEDFEL